MQGPNFSFASAQKKPMARCGRAATGGSQVSVRRAFRWRSASGASGVRSCRPTSSPATPSETPGASLTRSHLSISARSRCSSRVPDSGASGDCGPVGGARVRRPVRRTALKVVDGLPGEQPHSKPLHFSPFPVRSLITAPITLELSRSASSWVRAWQSRSTEGDQARAVHAQTGSVAGPPTL